MSTLNQSAPPAAAPKSDFIKLEPFPEAGPATLTIVAYNYIAVHEFENDKGEKYNGPALEFYLGAATPSGPRFLKTWPKSYSLRNNSFYYKLYKAAIGKEPAPGSKPEDILGKGVQGTIELKDKVSAKGTKYVACNVDPKSISAVHPKLLGDVTPLASLLPAFEAALKPKDKNAPAGPADAKDGDVPF